MKIGNSNLANRLNPAPQADHHWAVQTARPWPGLVA
jgi:hypothetical protein